MANILFYAKTLKSEDQFQQNCQIHLSNISSFSFGWGTSPTVEKNSTWENFHLFSPTKAWQTCPAQPAKP